MMLETSLQRVFYLCFSVKIEFLNSFSLNSLSPSSIIVLHSLFIFLPLSLWNCFNLCLFELLNFEHQFDSEEDDGGKIMNDFYEKLQSYHLFTLKVRIYNKLLIFARGIKRNARSPLNLQSSINLPFTPDVQI